MHAERSQSCPLKRLGLRDTNVKGVYRTPLEVFTGHRPARPLLRAMPIAKYPVAVAHDEWDMRRIMGIAPLQHTADSMHRKVLELTSASRKRRIVAHNEKTGIVRPSFGVGDFVLVRQTRPGGHKLQLEWRGPRRVTKTLSKWTCEVENLLHGTREVVHARRMLPYRTGLQGARPRRSSSRHLQAWTVTIRSRVLSQG